MAYAKTAWVNDSVPAVNATNLNKLEQGVYDAHVTADGAVVRLNALPAMPKITTGPLNSGPPASPTDGDIWIATGVGAGGQRWMFSYDSAESTAYKWKFVGGPSIGVADLAGTARQNTVANTWQAVPGLSTLSAARGGFYTLRYGGTALGATNTTEYMGVGSSVGTIFAPYQFTSAASGDNTLVGSVDMVASGIAAIAASGSFVLQTNSAVPASNAIYFPWMDIAPIKVA